MTPPAPAPRLCVLQHHPLETPGYILNWAQARGMQVQVRFAWETAPAENLDQFDALILLGGPYSVSDASALPWLAHEISWLKNCVAAGVPVFGICLGAQLLAHCLGAQVARMTAPDLQPAAELGWTRIIMCNEFAANAAGSQRAVLQWHSDTFQLPAGGTRLAHSVFGRFNQGFKLAERKLMGVQFHPEWNASTYATLIDCLADVETAIALRAALAQTALFDLQEALCAALLDFWLQGI